MAKKASKSAKAGTSKDVTSVNKTSKRGLPMKGKGAAQEHIPVYRPSIYFDNGNVPNSLRDAKPGAQVSLVVTGRVTSRTEDAKGVSNVRFEVGKVDQGRRKGK